MDKEEYIIEIMRVERAGRQALMRVNWTGSADRWMVSCPQSVQVALGENQGQLCLINILSFL